MGLMDKLKKVTGTDNSSYSYDDSYYDEFGDTDPAPVEEEQDQAAPYGGMGMGMSGMSMGAGSGISLSGTALELKVVKPQHFESVPQIADHLLNKRTVVLNLEDTNKETARRLIDFLSGVAYSIDGSLKKIASNAYVITPSNVDVGDAMLKDRRAKAEAPSTPAEAEEPKADASDMLSF